MQRFQAVCDDCGPIAVVRRRRGLAARDVTRHACPTPAAQRRPVTATALERRRGRDRRVVDDPDELMRVARSAVKSWCWHHPDAARRADPDDLLSIAAVGIATALPRFQPGRGVPVAAYVYHRAYGAIIDHVRTMAPLTRSEHSAGMRFADLPAHRRDAVTFTTLVGDDPTREAVICDPRGERGYEVVEARATVDGLFALLNRQQRYVIQRYDIEGYKMLEIAAELHVTEGRVCQIRKAALEAMATGRRTRRGHRPAYVQS